MRGLQGMKRVRLQDHQRLIAGYDHHAPPHCRHLIYVAYDLFSRNSHKIAEVVAPHLSISMQGAEKIE